MSTTTAREDVSEKAALVDSAVGAAVTKLAEEPKQVEVSKSLEDLFEESAGGGTKNLGANDLAIPYIVILQKGSPQVSKMNAKYIKGAETGTILNTVSQELIDGQKGIQFIPCGYQKMCVRWKSRDSGGGLVCSYDEHDPILKTFKKNERGQLFDEASGDIIVDTAYHYGLVPHEDGFPDFAVVSMYSTQLKKSRVWNTTMRKIMKKSSKGHVYNPPSYAYVYRLTTIAEQKKEYDWAGWSIAMEREVTDIDIFKMAQEFSKQVEGGYIRASAPPQDFVDAADGASDEVPF